MSQHYKSLIASWKVFLCPSDLLAPPLLRTCCPNGAAKPSLAFEIIFMTNDKIITTVIAFQSLKILCHGIIKLRASNLHCTQFLLYIRVSNLSLSFHITTSCLCVPLLWPFPPSTVDPPSSSYVVGILHMGESIEAGTEGTAETNLSLQVTRGSQEAVDVVWGTVGEREG